MNMDLFGRKLRERAQLYVYVEMFETSNWQLQNLKHQSDIYLYVL